MKKISFWASKHILAARVLIVVLKLFLAAMAYYVGTLLNDIHQKLPAQSIYTGLLVLLTAVMVFYPDKQQRNYPGKSGFIRQKNSDFILSAGSFILIATMVCNQNTFINPVTESFASSVVLKHPPTAEEILNSLKYRDKKSLSGKEKRTLKKELRQQLKLYAKSKIEGDKENSDKALLIILTIIAAIGLLALLSGLVCSIACGGSDILAILVGVLGFTGLIWATVAVIKSIKRGHKKTGDKTK